MNVSDTVVVATDAPEVARAVEDAGGVAVLTAAGHSSGTDRIAEVARHEAYRSFDVILNVQGDEPFVPGEGVQGALRMVAGGRFSLGTAAARAPHTILDEPSVVKVVCGDDGRALYFSRAGVPFLRDSGDAGMRTPLVLQHLGIYAYKRAALEQWVSLPEHPLERVERLEQLRPLAAGLAMGVATIDTPPLVGVDTEDDLARANQRWADLYAGQT